MRTFKYKLQDHKRNKHLHSDLEIIAHVYNHFVALCRRHYRIYGECEGYKRLTFNRMSQHLTKLKRLDQITINSVYTKGRTTGELRLYPLAHPVFMGSPKRSETHRAGIHQLL